MPVYFDLQSIDWSESIFLEIYFTLRPAPNKDVYRHVRDIDRLLLIAKSLWLSGMPTLQHNATLITFYTCPLCVPFHSCHSELTYVHDNACPHIVVISIDCLCVYMYTFWLKYIHLFVKYNHFLRNLPGSHLLVMVY